MLGPDTTCTGNRLCDNCNDEGLSNGVSQLVDGVHWSGRCPHPAWQEEVLPAAAGCHVEQKGVVRWGHSDAQNAPLGDKIEHLRETEIANAFRVDELDYHCDFVPWDEAASFAMDEPVALQPQCPMPCSSEAMHDEVENLHFQFDLSQSRDEDSSAVQFVVNLEPEPNCVLVVNRVEPNSAFAVTASGEKGLLPCDVILEVDGWSGSAQELKSRIDAALFSRAIVNILVRPRPTEFSVEVHREGRFWSCLGVQVFITERRGVQVGVVRDKGLLPEWNASHWPTLQILPGDHITRVNGDASDAHHLYEALLMGGHLHLRIATPLRKTTVEHQGADAESTASGCSSRSPSRTSSVGNSASGYIAEEG